VDLSFDLFRIDVVSTRDHQIHAEFHARTGHAILERYGMTEKTAAEFTADGFFISGDLGKIDREGYVHIVGRGKDLV
ncbi:hypothetical protein ACC691_41640, partial [Rhizobium johnstonii]|uniref:hypothetical protein n=1 Tax=Rhizobium johnstonii TaxID=3019933 RepID=UPI003F96B196